MIDKIISILVKQEAALQNLLKELEIQYKRVLGNDVKAIEEMIKRIQILNREVAFLEVEKKKVLKGESLSSFLNSNYSDELDQCYRRLWKLVHAVKLQKDSNDLLLKQKISFTNKILRLTRPNQDVSVYNAYGKIE